MSPLKNANHIVMAQMKMTWNNFYEKKQNNDYKYRKTITKTTQK